MNFPHNGMDIANSVTQDHIDVRDRATQDAKAVKVQVK